MKTPLFCYAIILFTIGFILLNGYHNFLSMLFVGVLLTVFVAVPLYIRIRYAIRDLSRHASFRRNQWA